MSFGPFRFGSPAQKHYLELSIRGRRDGMRATVYLSVLYLPLTLLLYRLQ